MRYLIVLFSVLLLTSCYTQKQAINKFCKPETRIKDSVVVRDSIHIIDSLVQKTVIKDSIVYIKAVKDSGEVSASENSTYKFNNGNVKVEIKVGDGKVKWKIDQQATISRFQSIIDSVSHENQVLKQRDSTNVKEKIVTVKEPCEGDKWYSGILEWVKNGLALIGLIWLISFLFQRVIKVLSN